MPPCTRSRIINGFAILLLASSCASPAFAQTEDLTGGEYDPIKLFERGQAAHAKGDLTQAVAFYEEAIKLRPEFPEAECQRGIALVSLDRLPEAEKSFRRAMELRKEWSLPYTWLGSLLARSGREVQAEPLLRRALELGAKDYVTLYGLSTIRLRAGEKKEALALARRATEDAGAPALAWAWRGAIERDTGDEAAAIASLDRALEIEPNNFSALKERAELRAKAGNYDGAIEDWKAALAAKPDNKDVLLKLEKTYELAGRPEEARRIAEMLGPVEVPSGSQTGVQVSGTPEEIEAANSADPAKARPALEKLVANNPRNARLLARLGEVTRTTDPQKSLEYYRRANEIDPRNPDYAAGYGAALVQARRFAEAVEILRRVVMVAPSNHAAHANLATALYELKRYAEALPELEWLTTANPPDPAMIYYFIGSAHDHLGEYQEALPAYERFLAGADAARNKREIETVQIRLPKLRDQIKRGKGVKRKPQ